MSFLILSFVSISFADNLSPVGTWKQFSDKTGQLQSIIKIWNDNGKLNGKVMQSFAMNGIPPRQMCSNCPGQFQNKKIIGMTLLWGFSQTDEDSWDNGKILDPDSGKIYSCNMQLLNNGQALKVRGYIGISLLGRSQIWERTNSQPL